MSAVMRPVRHDLSNGLHWLRGELEQSLARVRDHIDQSMEREDADLLLQKCVVELHQIRGIATVIQCYGAANLADAMKVTVQALASDEAEIRDREAAITALLGASVQLSDYLDLLSGGEQDALLVFHPIINELRVSCGQGVLSEADLVTRHIFDAGLVELDAVVDASREAPASVSARKLLPALHKAMRGWVRGEDRIDSLKRIGRITEHLQSQASGPACRLMMQATAAAVECLLALKLSDSLELKRQMGQVGELTKRLAMTGESTDDSAAMVRAAVRLGVEVHRSGARSRRARALIERLELDDCLVPDARIEQLRTRVRGPNTDVLTRVATEIREDFAQVKDEIDLAIRTGQRAPEQHESMARTLKRVSDTLSMLDLGALQRVIDHQADVLDKLALDAADSSWMELATALLLVEHNLEDALFGHVRAGSGDEDRRDPATVLAAPPPVKLDHREGAAAALRESLINVSQLKDQISEYIDRGEPGLLADAKRMLHQVESALSLLESERGAGLVARLRESIGQDGFRDIRDDVALADQFADAVALAECYLEALQRRQPQTAHLLDQLEAKLDAAGAEIEEAEEPVTVADDAVTGGIQIPEPVNPDEIDPEIREVFLEEAVEVLETLRGHLPGFLRDTENKDTLGTIRRAFHTLKGSGRMVGANDIGEFGWSVEHMLNRCLEGALSVTPAVVKTLEQAVNALPGVIDNFRQGEPLSDEARALVAQTDRVARGAHVDELDDDYDPEIHRIFREDARQHLDTMRQWLDDVPANEHGRFPVSQELVRALHTVTGSAAALSLESVSELASELENLCETVMSAGLGLGDTERTLVYESMTELGAWLDADESGAGSHPGLDALRERAAQAHRELPEDVRKASARRRLVVTFTDEAAELLDTVEQELQAWKATPTAEHHARKVGDALHTLKGSASMADIEDVREQAAAMRERVLAQDAADAGAPDEAWFAAMNDSVETVYQLLDAHRSGLAMPSAAAQAALFETAEPADDAAEAVVGDPATEPDNAVEVSASVTEPSAAEPASESAEAAPPPHEAASVEAVEPAPAEPALEDDAAFDAELAATFAEEAGELLQDIDRAFSSFEDDPQRGEPLDEIARALHTLKGGARTAGIAALGTASHRLEDVVGAMQSGQLSRDAAVVSQLHNVVDGFHGLVDQLSRAETLDASRVLDDIEDLQRLGSQAAATPAAGSGDVHDEPDVPDGDASAVDAPVQLSPDVSESSDGLPLVDEGTVAASTTGDVDSASDPMGVEEPPIAPPEDVLQVTEVAPDPQAADPAPEAAPPSDPVETPAEDAFEIELDLSEFESMEMAPAEVSVSGDGMEDELPPETAEASQPSAEDALTLPAEPPVTVAPSSSETAASSVATDETPAAPDDTGLLAGLDQEVVDIFLSEARELLDEMGTALSGLAAAPERQDDAIASVRRCLHTLKGSARMAGLDALGEQTHVLETELEAQLPGGQFTPQWLRDAETGVEQLAVATDEVERIFRGQAPATALVTPLADEPPLPEPAPEQVQAAAPVAVDDPLPADEERVVSEQDLLIDDGEDVSEVAATTEDAEPDPVEPVEVREWDERLFWTPDTQQDQASLVRRETARVTVEQLDTMLNQAGEVGIFHSRLEAQSTSQAAQLNELQQTITRARAQLRQMDLETDAQIQARQQGRADQNPDRYEDEFDPLEMDRYTRMQELSRALNESVADLENIHETLSEQVAEADGMLRHQGQINTSLQQGLMSTLMVPFSRQVQRLQRVVRQTASEFGRAVVAEFEGIESEMDRNVLERMTGPLEHLLRNAVYHGIESPEDRLAAGKPETGRIDVRLRREGTQLVMEVADDGRGLDLLKIRGKAIERGLLSPTAEPSDEAVAQFIFEPGFSTADALSQVAGRGVGMDVVGAEVKHLGGSVDVRSELGKGVRFLIRLPLSLAISRALLMSVGEETYAVPIGGVQGIGRLPADDLASMAASETPAFQYGGEHYAVRYVGSLLGLPTPDSFEARNLPVILTAYTEGLGGEERRVALVCDQVLGNREIVSKQVGPQVGAIEGMAGATIMPDGEVVLILDLSALLRADAQRATLTPRTAESNVAPTDSPHELTVMVVDDSITMRRVAERLLGRNGYQVTTAKDGMDAMAQLQSERPDVMLLDIEMPRVDGFEVATYVRNTPELSSLPIIMITSRSGDKHRERAARIGVNRYLIKPYQEAQLLGEIESVLADSQEPRHG